MPKHCKGRTIAAIGAFITVINMAMPLTDVAAAPEPGEGLCEQIDLVDPPDRRHQAYGNVEPHVTTGGDTVYSYNLRLCNRTRYPVNTETAENLVFTIVDFEIPYFGEETGIMDIGSPGGWEHHIVTLGDSGPNGWSGGISTENGPKFAWQINGPTKEFFDNLYGGATANPFNNVTRAIRWYHKATFPTPPEGGEEEGEEEGGQSQCFDPANAETGQIPPTLICPQQSLAGFEFIADYPGTNAPDESSWASEVIIPNDPPLPDISDEVSEALAFFPNSPAVQRDAVQTPEPSTLGLLGLGVLGTAFVRIRRKRPI